MKDSSDCMKNHADHTKNNADHTKENADHTKETAEAYRGILDEVTAMITVIDCETFRILYANQAAKDATKDKPGDYVGSVCYAFISGRKSPCGHCMMKRAVAAEYDSREVIYGHSTYKQLFKFINWNGRKALLEYSEDITEQKQNLLYAQHEKDSLSRIINYIPAGILVFHLDQENFTIAAANPAICQMMGIDGEQALGAGSAEVMMLTHPDDIPLIWEVIGKLRQPGAQVQYEYRCLHRQSHRYMWLSAHGRSVGQPDGTVLVYISYVDITEQKKLHELQNRLNQAEQTAAAKSEFYSRMSHDMRTPMNGILGLSSLAEKETDLDRLHTDLKKIHESGTYMLGLINDTLDLQRMESGHMKLEPKVVFCKAIVDDMLSMIRPGLEEKHLTLEVEEATTKMDCFILVDPMRVKQIGMNLLSNAVKFTPPGGLIRIHFENLGVEQNLFHGLIEVTDTGVGMSPEFVEQGVFQPFSQEANLLSGTASGSGLGLSIAKKLVELMGGTIEVESELGTGTTFRIRMDIQMVSPEEAAKQQEAAAAPEDQKQFFQKLHGKRVLLVEDHPLNAEITIRLLERAGCKVTWAKNGLEGTKLFNRSAEGGFDGILMDIRMPVMDGLTAARVIRSSSRRDAKTIPIIAMSANAYVEDIQKSKEAGMDLHLAKPVEPKELYRVLLKEI